MVSNRVIQGDCRNVMRALIAEGAPLLERRWTGVGVRLPGVEVRV